MHLFRSSKRSKDSRSISPTPSPRSNPTTAGSAARFRRRQTDQSILPLNNGTPPTPAWKKQGHSNFLYGGQYYPEGRRRRKIHRDYPLWQRIFCSSPSRMLITILMLTYIAVFHVLWPFLHFMIQKVSSHGSTILRGSDLLLHLSYSPESLARMEALRHVGRRMPPTPPLPSRPEYLAQMYPQFYHRNSKQDLNSNSKSIRSLQTPDHRRPHCPKQTLQDVTLVLQTTLQRLPVLQETFVALEEKDASDYSVLVDSYDCPHTLWIPYHLTESPSDYPVNLLRNLGLEAVTTSHVLVVDADFVPSAGLDQAIVQNLVALESQQALVIPAFERIMDCESHDDCLQYLQTNSSFIPHTMEELETCVHTHDCRVFQSNNNPEGHSSTHSKEWLYERRKENDMALHAIECFDSLRYEPYLVLPWCANNAVPYYDERFHGYGKNKIQHVQHIRFWDSRFLVHSPHPESAMKEQWKDGKVTSLHREMDVLYRDFLRELLEESSKRLNVNSIVMPCES